jgi:hypothetical protein
LLRFVCVSEVGVNRFPHLIGGFIAPRFNGPEMFSGDVVADRHETLELSRRRGSPGGWSSSVTDIIGNGWSVARASGSRRRNLEVVGEGLASVHRLQAAGLRLQTDDLDVRLKQLADLQRELATFAHRDVPERAETNVVKARPQ